MVVLSLGISLAIILILVNKKVNMGYSMVAAATVLALLNGRSIGYIVTKFVSTIKDSTTITLAFTIGLITILAYLMDQYLILDRMVSTLEVILRSAKLTILLAPSIMGTLSVYGGALMSCPIVGRLGDRLSMTNDEKATINLIFRHTLYLIFPISPAMILASKLGGIAAWDLIKIQLPISLFMYIFGYILFIRNYKDPEIKKISKTEYIKSIFLFILYALPIIVSLLGTIVFKVPVYISLIVGICYCIALNMYDNRRDSRFNIDEHAIKTIYKGLKIPLVLTVIGIMFYRNIVTDMSEIHMFLSNLLDMGMPLELLIFIASGIICISLASPQPGIAILFPLILPLAPTYEIRLMYAMFIFTNSFLFYYISPLHLCQILTLEYFQVGIKRLYRNYMYLIPLTFISMVIIYTIKIL